MDKLTIFYNKRTGVVKELCSGEQDMDWFGDEKQDYELIFDYIIVDFDAFILENYMYMKVVDGAIKMEKQEVPSRYL